jgi:hypothetical protein
MVNVLLPLECRVICNGLQVIQSGNLLAQSSEGVASGEPLE